MSKIEKINVIAGPSKGKTYTLKDAKVVIGSGSECDIAIGGKFVDELHAELIHQEDGRWQLINHSINGTLVNQEMIDSRLLSHGDVIQVGSESLLGFQVIDKDTTKKRSTEGKEKQDYKGVALFKNPIVFIGLGIYLVLIIIVVVFVMDARKTKTTPILQVAEVNNSIKETQIKLGKIEAHGCASVPTQKWGKRIDRDAELAADYYTLVNAKQSDDSDVSKEELIKSIIDKIKQDLFQAWLLEKQGKVKHAILRYQRIADTIPNIHCATTKLAIHRINVIKEKESE